MHVGVGVRSRCTVGLDPLSSGHLNWYWNILCPFWHAVCCFCAIHGLVEAFHCPAWGQGCLSSHQPGCHAAIPGMWRTCPLDQGHIGLLALSLILPSKARRTTFLGWGKIPPSGSDQVISTLWICSSPWDLNLCTQVQGEQEDTFVFILANISPDIMNTVQRWLLAWSWGGELENLKKFKYRSIQIRQIDMNNISWYAAPYSHLECPRPSLPWTMFALSWVYRSQFSEFITAIETLCPWLSIRFSFHCCPCRCPMDSQGHLPT